MAKDLYAVIGCERTATAVELKKAYHRCAAAAAAAAAASSLLPSLTIPELCARAFEQAGAEGSSRQERR